MNASGRGTVDQLYEIKLRKLHDQKVLSDQMNDLLTKHGGLNESSKCALKNLQAAIAVSKKPGYFEYYNPSDDVKITEEKKILNAMARNIQKSHRELELINEEIAQATAAKHQTNLESIPSVTSLSQWFDMYGRAKITEEKQELMTKFDTNPKIYGGTSHHKSFKTVSTVMRKGRITR